MAKPSFLLLTRANIVIVTFLPTAKLKINLPPNRKFRLSYSNKYDTAYHLLSDTQLQEHHANYNDSDKFHATQEQN